MVKTMAMMFNNSERPGHVCVGWVRLGWVGSNDVFCGHWAGQGADKVRTHRDKKGRKLAVLMVFLAVILVIKTPLTLAKIDEKKAIKGIVGEARGEGKRWNDWKGKKKAMTAVAEAIRNRGTLDGVLGVNEHGQTKKDPKAVRIKCEELAKEAWADSRKTKMVKGATHWESEDFPKPKWARKMVVTAKVGKHTYYKEIK